MRGSYFLTALSLALGLCGFAFVEGARADGPREQASLHFRRGVELFQEEAYRAALVEFERAQQLSPDYRLLYNIGQTRFELQDYLGAAQAYEGYLTEGGNRVPHEQRLEVESALQSLRGRVGQISLTVNRDGADVFLDDAKIGVTPVSATIAVNVGRHRLLVRTADGATDTKLVDVAGGEIAEVSLFLAPPKLAEPALDQAAPRMPVLHKLAIAGWSVGGAALLGAVATGVLAMRADKDLDAMFGRADLVKRDVSEQRDQVKTLMRTTNALIGAGAATAALGTLMWLLGSRKDDEHEQTAQRAMLRWEVGPSSLAVSGHF